MKVSLNTIKRFTKVELANDELLARINTQLGGVESVSDMTDIYKDAVIVSIVSCEKHPNADKLHVCLVDDGRLISDVPRTSDGYVEVVCGAPNVRSGMLAVWLPPGSIVPASYYNSEPFVLGARELRGVISQGMLASPKELGLGDGHDGILELDAEESTPNAQKPSIGMLFGKLYGLDDVIIDIENKMFTHRPDCFGQLGVAREIAGIQQIPFISPDWYTTKSVPLPHMPSSAFELTVFNDAKELVPRFMSVVIQGITIKASPVWLQTELVRLGGKPINNVVDVTNYVMLLTGQPTHAYDFDKLRGKTLGARHAKKGEQVSLLNGKTYQLTDSDIVIADSEGPIGLAGIMGGSESEVSSDTTTIVLECANFDMYAVRRSSMRHGIFTDALTRFNKGQSPHQNPAVLRKLIELIVSIAGGEIASEVFDESKKLPAQPTVKVSAAFINQRLGLSLTESDITALLTNVEFTVQPGLEVTRPFWRTDIELPEDIVEEVGRLYGFDSLPRVLPLRPITPATINQMRAKQATTRSTMKALGANELLTYSFVHEKLLLNSGQDASHAYRLTNALSPDLQYYRLSLTPSLLDKVHMNLKTGHDIFALYEIGKTHLKEEIDAAEPDVPNEDTHLALVFAAADKMRPKGAAYFQAKYYLEKVVDLNGYEVSPLTDFDTSNDTKVQQLVAPYAASRSAVIVKDDRAWGVVGELRAEVSKAFKLPTYVAAFEIHADLLQTRGASYVPLSRFPSTQQDISIRTNDVPYAVIKKAVDDVISRNDELHVTMSPLAIYKSDDADETTTTFRLKFVSYERTLTDTEIRPIISQIGERVAAFGGRIV